MVVWLLGAATGFAEAAPARGREGDGGPTFDALIEAEKTARLLAVLLDSGRAVINENQPLYDSAVKDTTKGLTPEVFERQLVEVFRSRSGLDLNDLSSARLSAKAVRLLRALVSVSKQVVAEAQGQINRPDVTFSGFIPAVYGARTAAQFTKQTGVRLKQTSLAPRNPGNAPDPFEQAALRDFADPAYPREKTITEITARNGALRLMFPLYATRHCLDCHGEPKGEIDKTGYPKEGLQLGHNAGAISVVIPVKK
jgi:general secretion pathway protein A